MTFARFAAVVVSALLGAGCALFGATPPATASQVDLARYMGRWYVIAHMPDGAEGGRVGSYMEYRPREDGRIDGVYGAHPGSFERELESVAGLAWVDDPATNARWQVEGPWPVDGDYLILYVSEDYRYALAGHPSRDQAWVLSREPEIPEWVYAGLLARLAAQQFDVAELRKVAQTQEQVGQEGFE